MENSKQVPQKVKIEIPYDTESPLLGIDPKKTKTLLKRLKERKLLKRHLCFQSSITKIWKHSKYSPTDEWIKRMWYTYWKVSNKTE